MKQNSKVNKSKLRLGASIVGAMAGALAILSASEAHAATSYFEPSLGGNTWVMGNSEFQVFAQAMSHQMVDGSFTDNRPTYKTTSQDYHGVYAKVFGEDETLIWAGANGLAESRSGKYASVGGSVDVLGSRVWTADPEGNADCPPSDVADTACDRWDKDWSKTFFHAEKQFMVSWVPVTVSATIRGGVRAHLSAHTLAMQGAPANKKHHLGVVTLGSGAGAYATASMTALAGVEGILAVGVTASFKLIDATAVSNSKTIHRNDDVMRALIASYDLGFNVTSMSGKVDVWAQLSPFLKPTTTLINVAGFSKFIPIDQSSRRVDLPALEL